MNDVITWPMVVLAFITALPGIIASFAALKAAKASGENKVALALNKQDVQVVHDLVNSHYTKLEDQLNAALKEIGALKGLVPKTVAEAPTNGGASNEPPAPEVTT